MFELEREEMYGERFDVPGTDELVMLSWFQGGEVFRSLCAWRRGAGKVLYFRPGHETYPTYHDVRVQRILANAANYARKRIAVDAARSPRTAALSPSPTRRKTTSERSSAREGSPMHHPVRVAVIGTGGISHLHVEGFRKAGAEVVALCDVDEHALARRKREWGVDRCYQDFRRLFADGGFDAVTIAAPTVVHHPATLAAAAAGVHVLVEKPMALSLELADEMIQACRRAGVLLQVNHQCA